MTGATAMALDPHVREAIRRSRDRIVITGASGWIGRSALHLLREALGDVFDDRVRCFGSAPRAIEFGNGARIEQAALADLGSLSAAPTLVLHLAFLTKDRAETMDEKDYAEACRAVDSIVLAQLDAIGARSAFVASSGAASRADDSSASSAMRTYGRLKREQEGRFAQWADEHRRRVVIARLFNLSGPYINKHRSYALSSFILDALGGGPIRIAADRPVVRAYVAVRELLSLVLAMLLDERPGPDRFESGGEPMEMQRIAQVVADALGGCAIARPMVASGGGDTYCGDHEGYRALLREYRIDDVPFPQQVRETVDFLSFSESR